MKKLFIIILLGFFIGQAPAQWQKIKTFTSPTGYTLEVYSLFYDSSYGIFAGVRFEGLFHSSDNGTTWEFKGFKVFDRDVKKISRDNLGRLILNNDFIYFSSDSGNTWQSSNLINYSTGSLENISVLEINMDNGNWYAGSERRNLYYSGNNGESWSFIKNFQPGCPCPYGDLTAIKTIGENLFLLSANNFCADNQGTYCDETRLYKSLNGIIWYEVLNKEVKNIIVTDAGSILAFTGRELFKSDNQGDNWEKIYTFQYDVNIVKVDSEGFIYAGFWKGVIYSTDFGSSWKSLDYNGLHHEVNDITIDKNRRIFAATSEGIYLNHTPVTKIDEKLNLNPTSSKLYPNYPNPFNPETKIRFYIPNRSNVIIKIFDVLGNQITELVSDIYNEGLHEINWKPENLSSGVFVCRMSTINYETKKAFTSARKLIYVK